jgi:NADPH:quinone reductase-like Zn-dependent oxidoreductase
VVRRREAVDELKALGAEAVLSSAVGPIDEQVRRILPAGVKYAVDPVGGATGTGVFNSLADNARMLVYGTLSGEPLQIDPRRMISGRRVVEGFWLGHWMRERSIPSALLVFREVGNLIRSGVLATQVGRSFPIEDAGEACRLAVSAARTGKVLLQIAQR